MRPLPPVAAAVVGGRPELGIFELPYGKALAVKAADFRRGSAPTMRASSVEMKTNLRLAFRYLRLILRRGTRSDKTLKSNADSRQNLGGCRATCDGFLSAPVELARSMVRADASSRNVVACPANA